jgi:hypothetical protein
MAYDVFIAHGPADPSLSEAGGGSGRSVTVLGSAFTDSIAANLVAGVILLGITVLVVDVWLEHRKSRRNDVNRRKAALGAVRTELESNQGQTDDLRNPEVKTPFVTLYSVSGWDLVNQATVFTALEPATVQALSEVYSGLRYLNDANRVVADQFYGAAVTEIEFALILGNRLEDLRPVFEQRQAESLANLVDIVDKLLYPNDHPKGVIRFALERVEYEIDKESKPFWRKILPQWSKWSLRREG